MDTAGAVDSKAGLQASSRSPISISASTGTGNPPVLPPISVLLQARPGFALQVITTGRYEDRFETQDGERCLTE